jgi:hypothetical protein
MKGTILVAAAAALALSGCSADYVTQSQADVLLEVVSIEGTTGGGGTGSGTGAVLHSDVQSATGVFNDNATINFRVITKNALLPTTGSVNDVMLERYEVKYLRSDGRATEGVDVPYRITGPMALRVAAGGDGQASIVVVRQQAKLEPPLKNLRGAGGAIVLTCIAEMTFHGTTTSGKVALATGRLQITFADFAD